MGSLLASLHVLPLLLQLLVAQVLCLGTRKSLPMSMFFTGNLLRLPRACCDVTTVLGLTKVYIARSVRLGQVERPRAHRKWHLSDKEITL
jgi:hypothetical protein